METIWNYLDNMFVNLPQTPEVLRAKEDLAEMMEDKYNELIQEGKMQNEAIGIVISEFGNIQELIDELGIASFTNADFVKKEQKEQDHRTNRTASNLRHVSGLEADEYLFAMKQGSMNIATGVFLCICSPILLLLLTAAQKSFLPVADGLALGLGLTVLLCMVASAVALFIISGMKLEAYEYLQKECFILDQDYEYALRCSREARKKVFLIKIVAGVTLCILSAVPLIVTAIVTEHGGKEFLILLAVAFLLVFVGTAVALFITAGMEETSYQVILQEKEFSVKKKSGKKIEDLVAAIYWPAAVILYLVWSFASGAWHITWIMWPFAGFIFDFICKMIESAVKENSFTQ